MRYLLATMTVLLLVDALAQSPDKDQHAAEILHKIEQKVSALDDVTYTFSLRLLIPEQEPTMQHGSYIQQNNRYRLEMPSMISMSDGSNQWLVDKEIQEVQIHRFVVDDKDNIMNPTNLLTIYNNPHFEYMLSSEQGSGSHTLQQIEFKPKDRHSEYSKARLTVLKDKHTIEKIEVFGKNGTKYEVIIEDMQGNQHPDASAFQFDKAQYPGYHVEDLRID